MKNMSRTEKNTQVFSYNREPQDTFKSEKNANKRTNNLEKKKCRAKKGRKPQTSRPPGNDALRRVASEPSMVGIGGYMPPPLDLRIGKALGLPFWTISRPHERR